MRLTRRYCFSASHRLHSDQLPADHNVELYGKCNNPFGHGHNYELEVTVEGSIDTRTGRVISVGTLDGYVQQHVLSALDHRDLNADVPEFGSVVPTTENLAIVVDQRLRRHWNDAFRSIALKRIHIQETKRNSFELNS